MRALRTTLFLVALLGLVPACKSTGPVGPDELVSLFLSTTAVSFGAGESDQAVTLTNEGPAPVAWHAEETASWIAVVPQAGTLAPGAATVSIRVSREGLGPGTYQGQVRIVTEETELALTVTAEVDARPVASLDATTVDFGVALPSAELRLANAGNAPMGWSLAGPAWVAMEPAAGTLAAGAAAVITLAPYRSQLPAGVHTGTLTLSSDGGSSSVSVRVEVAAAAAPILRVEPGAIDFGTTGEAAGVTIANDGTAALSWSLTSDRAWLGAAPATGTLAPGASQVVTVSASRAGLAAGTHAGAVTVTSNGGSAVVNATMQVTAPPPQSVALAGQVVDQFTGAGVAGITVRFQGIAATTDGTGRFTVMGAPSSSLQDFTLLGGGIVPRATFARSTDTRWLAIPSSFDMNAFDDMAREYEPRTIRWLQAPAIYIDTRHVGPDVGPQLQTWIAEAQSAAAGFIAAWSNGVVGATTVQVGASPPPDGTAGWIIIRFDDDAGNYTGPNTVGNARTSWTINGRDISWSVVRLRFSLIPGSLYTGARTAVLGHELGHAMGMGHMDGGTSSIMTPSVSIASLSTFDARAGSILYSRSPGNTSPDTDSSFYYTGGLAPAGAPTREYQWVCGAPVVDLTP
jgi:hypothetical protein